MEIKSTDVNRVANIYRQNSVGQAGKSGAKETKKVDTVAISNRGMLMKEFGKVISSVAEEVHGSVSEERLQSLADSVKAGNYTVSSDDIARAIFNRIGGNGIVEG